MEQDSYNSRRSIRIAKRKKKRLFLFVAVIIVLAAVVAGVNACSGTVKRDGTFAQFEIAQGQSLKSIAQTLKENGLISSTSRFIRAVEKTDAQNSLRYGVYRIERGTDNKEIIKILSTGANVKDTITVTIPEGFSLERIIARVAELGISDENALTAAAKESYDYEFLSCIPDNSDLKYTLQGFLFPSTYEFKKDADARTVINTMLAEFDKQMKKEGITAEGLFEAITLASLIEREAKLESERATISGVIKNRIKKGMLLQIDATVVYAVSDGMYDLDRVLYKDLEIDSPYNTYKYKGLPVGPICSPGIKSIKAALNPEKHNYYYYRTDSQKADGSHIFTESFDEHKNVG